jgi:hypothetical protein
MTIMRVCAALLVLATACAKGGSDGTDTTAAAVPATADRATTAAAISNAISANPAAADSILKANGYTPEEFNRVMFEIASDSAQSARYAAAKQR